MTSSLRPRFLTSLPPNLARSLPAAWVLAGFLLVLSGCGTSGPSTYLPSSTTLPEVPAVDGPLAITLQHPPPQATRPSADSTFLFGSVGTGEARLRINGQNVEVAPNGAFLAYVPVRKTYEFVATKDDAVETLIYRYAPVEYSFTPIEPTRIGTVTAGRDTLDTGSVIASAMPAPGADRQWFFPMGSRLTVTGQRGDLYRIALTDETVAWVDTAAVSLEEAGTDGQGPAAGRAAWSERERALDLSVPVAFAPFLVRTTPDSLTLTIYASIDGDVPPPPGSFARQGAPVQTSADSTVIALAFEPVLWGYKAFYDDDGALILRLRRPPAIDPANPLSGLRVLVDAGHPPGGATGPTGLTEAEANLAITRRVADRLRERGAEVLLTRDSAEPFASSTSVATELWARVDFAVAQDADLLVSIHNNAFPSGVNPFRSYGTEVYYFHGFAAPLSEHLVGALVEVTGVPELGAKQRSLALVRPSWMPAALTESLFMMFPQQEAALRDPATLDRLAAAHVEGLAAYLRSVANER